VELVIAADPWEGWRDLDNMEAGAAAYKDAAMNGLPATEPWAATSSPSFAGANRHQ
jgi:hypothetical protein